MKIYLIILAMICVTLLAACANPPKVLQGTVIRCNDTEHILTIRDELNPESELEISYEGADVGAKPEPGDTVRIAYRERDGKLTATRIMNVSRQSK